MLKKKKRKKSLVHLKINRWKSGLSEMSTGIKSVMGICLKHKELEVTNVWNTNRCEVSYGSFLKGKKWWKWGMSEAPTDGSKVRLKRQQVWSPICLKHQHVEVRCVWTVKCKVRYVWNTNRWKSGMFETSTGVKSDMFETPTGGSQVTTGVKSDISGKPIGENQACLNLKYEQVWSPICLKHQLVEVRHVWNTNSCEVQHVWNTNKWNSGMFETSTGVKFRMPATPTSGSQIRLKRQPV